MGAWGENHNKEEKGNQGDTTKTGRKTLRALYLKKKLY